MIARTMALELHVARLQDLLEGVTAEERFRSFVRRLRCPEVALDLFREYPVLARQVVLGVDRWVETSLEFLGHLCTDWEAIRATFLTEGDPGALVAIHGGAGDSHRDGRSVVI